MAFLSSRGLIAAKVEVTEGTDSINSPADGGTGTHLMASNVNIQMNGENIERPLVLPTLSRVASVIGIKSATISFTTEMRGRGAVPSAATPLRDDPLFQGCGLSVAYAAGSATYTPISNLLKSVTIYAYTDGILHLLTGCRGNVEVVAEVGQFGRFNWTFQGRYAAIDGASVTAGGVQDRDLPTANFDAFSIAPPPILSANLSVDTVTGANICAQAVTFNMNNDVQPRPCMNNSSGIASFNIIGRNPGGSINPEAVKRTSAGGTTDYWRKWQQSTLVNVNYDINTGVVGNEMVLTMPKVQYGGITYGDRNGMRTYEIPYFARTEVSTGDDEFSLAFK